MTKTLLAAFTLATIGLSSAQAAVNPAGVANPFFASRHAAPQTNVAAAVPIAPQAEEKPAAEPPKTP